MWVIISELYVMLVLCIILVYIGVYGKVSWELMSVVLLIGGMLTWVSYGISEESIINVNWVSDSVIKSFKLLLYIIASIALISNVYGLESKVEYGWLVMLSVWALGILLNSANLLTFYISVEIQSLAFYVLVSYKRSSSYSTESGLKYFIVGSLSSGIMLLGLSILYSELGSLNYNTLSKLMLLEVNMWSNIGIMLVMISLYLKCSLAPFNMWYIDVVDGALMRSSMLISLVPKIGILGMLIKLLVIIGDNEIVKWSMVIVGVASIIVSMIGGYYQRKIKRFLGYSSIGNLGYMVLALSVFSNNELVIRSVTVYMLVYVLTGIAMWNMVEKSKVMYISELSKVRNNSILVSYLVIMLSMASVPPMLGFVAKVELVWGMISAGGVIIALCMLLCTIGISYNYLRWLKVLYNEREVRGVKEVIIYENKESLIISVVLVIITLSMWIM